MKCATGGEGGQPSPSYAAAIALAAAIAAAAAVFPIKLVIRRYKLITFAVQFSFVSSRTVSFRVLYAPLKLKNAITYNAWGYAMERQQKEEEMAEKESEQRRLCVNVSVSLALNLPPLGPGRGIGFGQQMSAN